MAKRDKRIAAMRRDPQSVRPDDLDVVLQAAGFVVRQQGTSHRVYKRGADTLVIPQRRPFLLETYVKHVLAFLEDV